MNASEATRRVPFVVVTEAVVTDVSNARQLPFHVDNLAALALKASFRGFRSIFSHGVAVGGCGPIRSAPASPEIAQTVPGR